MYNDSLDIHGYL